jgi:hypothetical protein
VALILSVSGSIFVLSHELPTNVQIWLFVPFLVCFIAAAVWNYRIQLVRVPALLFKLNGYPSKPRPIFRWLRRIPRDPTSAPWAKYRQSLGWLGGWVATLCVALILRGCWQLARVIAQHRLR